MTHFSLEPIEPRRLASVAAPVSIEGTTLNVHETKATGIFKAARTMKIELNASGLHLTEGDADPVRGDHDYAPASGRSPAALYFYPLTLAGELHFNVKTTFAFDSFSHGVYSGHYSMSLLAGPKGASGSETGTFTLALNPGVNQVQGMVFDDTNGDGKWVRGEKPIPAATVWADLDDDGRYDRGEPRFTTIRDGSYIIKRVPAGWSRTMRVALPKGYTALGPAGGAVTLPLRSDGVIPTANFGGGRDSVLRGSILRDIDADGVISAGDRLWSGTATVWADLNQDGRIDANEPQTQNVSGRFMLRGDIPAGTPVRMRTELSTVILPRKQGYVFTTNVTRATHVNYLVK